MCDVMHAQSVCISDAVAEQVRESIAENVCSLAPVIGREPTISELLPLVKLFLSEEQDGTASIEIRRKVLRSVAPLVETLGAEACDVHLMPEVGGPPALQHARNSRAQPRAVYLCISADRQVTTRCTSCCFSRLSPLGFDTRFIWLEAD